MREREAGGWKGAGESECVCVFVRVYVFVGTEPNAGVLKGQGEGRRKNREGWRDGGMEGGGDLLCERRGGGYAIFKCPYT